MTSLVSPHLKIGVEITWMYFCKLIDVAGEYHIEEVDMVLELPWIPERSRRSFFGWDIEKEMCLEAMPRRQVLLIEAAISPVFRTGGEAYDSSEVRLHFRLPKRCKIGNLRTCLFQRQHTMDSARTDALWLLSPVSLIPIHQVVNVLFSGWGRTVDANSTH